MEQAKIDMDYLENNEIGDFMVMILQQSSN